jgi:hypothetical protein
MILFAQLNIEELHRLLERASSLESELESFCDRTQSSYVSVRKHLQERP